MTERYDGKPFLRLLDGYILDAIGHLPPDEDAALAALAPTVAGVRAAGPWRAVVAQEMQFPDGFAGAVREVWDKGRPRFVAANGHEPDAAEFTRHFVDTNFAR